VVTSEGGGTRGRGGPCADHHHRSRAGGGDHLRGNPLNRNEEGEEDQRLQAIIRLHHPVLHLEVTAQAVVAAGQTAAIQSNCDVICEFVTSSKFLL